MQPHESRAARVFISYSHDSPTHQDRVLALANRLRADGLDARIDQYEQSPRDGWPLWTDLEIQHADFVLMICTQTYRRRVEHQEEPGKGLGVLWEGKIIFNCLYAGDSSDRRFIPILLDGGDPSAIPTPMQGLTHYALDTKDGYLSLYGRLSGQQQPSAPPVGPLKSLPLKTPQSYPASFIDTQPATPAMLNRRQRLAMINRVRHDWVDGVLNQSLYRMVRIELGLTALPDAVEQPLRAIVQVPDESPATLRPGDNIADSFEEHGRALLILGAPGTGKTTLLLQLADALLNSAAHDETAPIPVVFNLSTWAVRRQAIEQWLIDELSERSDVPKALAKDWVKTEQIIPLLDGLDEVNPTYREACVEAINSFRRVHGLLPIVVCSRVADYERLSTKLRLQHATLIQPLTRDQVEAYLRQVGPSLASLLDAFHTDVVLADLLTTPLMLWVATLAYRDSQSVPTAIDSAGLHTKLLFDAFVDAMFRRRSAQLQYPEKLTLRWLSWLASSLVSAKQSIFYLENIQLEWILRPNNRAYATPLILGSCAAVMVPFVWAARNGFLNGGGYGLVTYVVMLVLLFGLLAGLIGGLVSTLIELRPAERIQFGFRGLTTRLGKALRFGCVTAVFFGLMFAFTAWLIAGALTRLSSVVPLLELGAVAGPLFGLLGGLVSAVTVETIDRRTKPNQGTRNSIRTPALIAVSCVVLAAVVLAAAAFGFEEVAQDLTGLATLVSVSCLAVVLVTGLLGGGLFAIRHGILRVALWLSAAAPLNYVAFLDFSADRLFLRKVGGGYIFLHRMLLEHFSSRWQSDRQAVLEDKRMRHRRLLYAGIICGCMLAAALYASSTRPPIGVNSEAQARLNRSATQLLARTVENRSAPENRLSYPNPSASDSREPKHVIVIMLEDASFDRMLGALQHINKRIDGIRGDEINRDRLGHSVRVRESSELTVKVFPPTEFADVDGQIFERTDSRVATMGGFVDSRLSQKGNRSDGSEVMSYFRADRVPVLATLALEYAVCDRWFASVPGPSIPNHEFAEFGTSFGNVGNAINSYMLGAPYKSIYERLLDSGRTAKIYEFDRMSRSPGSFFVAKRRPELYGTLADFLSEARSGRLPEFSMIQPPTDEHAFGGSVSASELLVANVYNAIHSNQALWNSSVLAITYASHGGFYDHVPPPSTIPDGFVVLAQNTGVGRQFNFDRLGVRVPAVIVSPYVPKGTIDHNTYEHASIPATVTKIFLPDFDNYRRSPREAAANTFNHLLSLPAPRAFSDTVAFDTE